MAKSQIFLKFAGVDGDKLARALAVALRAEGVDAEIHISRHSPKDDVADLRQAYADILAGASAVHEVDHLASVRPLAVHYQGLFGPMQTHAALQTRSLLRRYWATHSSKALLNCYSLTNYHYVHNPRRDEDAEAAYLNALSLLGQIEGRRWAYEPKRDADGVDIDFDDSMSDEEVEQFLTYFRQATKEVTGEEPQFAEATGDD